MNAGDLTKALRGKWRSHYGVARCPAHPDKVPSLAIADGDRGVVVHCHSGCPQESVVGALQRLGLWPGRAEAPTEAEREQQRQRTKERERTQQRVNEFVG